jgi:hypothetical protein
VLTNNDLTMREEEYMVLAGIKVTDTTLVRDAIAHRHEDRQKRQSGYIRRSPGKTRCTAGMQAL